MTRRKLQEAPVTHPSVRGVPSVRVCFGGAPVLQSNQHVSVISEGTKRKPLSYKRASPAFWTAEEDAKLGALVRRLTNNDLSLPIKVSWAELAAMMPGRNCKQCRERWFCHLDPALTQEAWTAEEDAVLAAMVAVHGTCWAKISEHMKNRSDAACRQRALRLRKRGALCVQGVDVHEPPDAVREGIKAVDGGNEPEGTSTKRPSRPGAQNRKLSASVAHRDVLTWAELQLNEDDFKTSGEWPTLGALMVDGCNSEWAKEVGIDSLLFPNTSPCVPVVKVDGREVDAVMDKLWCHEALEESAKDGVAAAPPRVLPPATSKRAVVITLHDKLTAAPHVSAFSATNHRLAKRPRDRKTEPAEVCA
jgi:hypothetical protein